MMKKYFFSKRKVEMHYSKRDKMIMMPLFKYNIYYVVILRSFLRQSQFRGHMVTFLENRHRNRRAHVIIRVCSCTVPVFIFLHTCMYSLQFIVTSTYLVRTCTVTVHTFM